MYAGVGFGTASNGIVETIKNDRKNTIGTNSERLLMLNRLNHSALSKLSMSATMMMAAPGIGRPTKYSFFSVNPTLKRASRTAPETAGNDDTINPNTPNSLRPKAWTRNDGAIPNETTSLRESSWTPNELEECVSLAIMPSRTSKNPARTINQQA